MTGTVLVVGGAGYIGSHACKELARAGYRPVVFDNLVYGHRDAVKWGPFVEGDIRDGAALDAVLQTYRPEAVLHFAAFAYVGESVQKPDVYYDNNVGGTISLLNAMVRNGVKRIVFSSTCATYGIPDTLPITETTPQNPINPYGYTKLVVERMLADYATAYEISWAAMRYFNAAGADPEGEIGERHDPETHAIPLALKAAFGAGGEFSVFGTDYDTPDGSAVRDYIHVTDLATAHVEAIRFLQAGGASQAFNLATGTGVSVLELIDAIARVTGRQVPFQTSARRAGDPPSLYAAASKARTVLDWEPQHSSIDEIIRTAAPWFSDQN